MTLIHADLVEGDVSLDCTADRKTITRQMLVINLEDPAYQRLIQADQAYGMPRMGDEYPGLSTLTVRRLKYRAAKDTDKVYATVEYEGVEEQTDMVIDCDGVVDTIEANRDKNGDLMFVTFTPEGEGVEPLKQPVLGPTFRPGIVVTIPKKLNVEQGDSKPVDLGIAYIGRVNQAGWRLAPGAPAKAWMCTAVRGTSQDGGKTYDASFSFQWRRVTDDNPSPWDLEGVYIDPATNRMPDGVVVGEGIKRFELVDDADFNAMNLDIP